MTHWAGFFSFKNVGSGSCGVLHVILFPFKSLHSHLKKMNNVAQRGGEQRA
jgi:hypothetical protein